MTRLYKQDYVYITISLPVWQFANVPVSAYQWLCKIISKKVKKKIGLVEPILFSQWFVTEVIVPK